MALTTAFVGTVVTGAESTTNWGNDTITAAEQWDLRVQNQYSIGFQASNKDGMGYYDYSATGSFDFTSGGTDWGKHVYMWVNYLSSFNLDPLVAGTQTGCALVIGSSSSDYAGYCVFDNTTFDRYPGGWKLWALDPRKPPSWTVGTPDYSAIDMFGVWVETTSSFRADNLFIDAIKVGTGIRAYGTGTTDDSWQDILDDDMGTEANRWGIAQEQDGIIYLYGQIDIGDDQSTNATTFTDQGRILQWVTQEYYDANGDWVPLIGDDLFEFNIVSNSTGSTSFTDGVIVGTDSGRSGSTFIGSDLHDVVVNLDDGNNASNDVNLYNTSFKQIKRGINWINDGDHVFYNGVVAKCGQFDPVGAPIIRNCTFAETAEFPTALDAAVMEDNGTSFTDETADANDSGGAGDVNLLPATPNTNDAFYFGSQYKFDTITIDITTSGGATTVLAWEYYNGSTWAAVTGLEDGTDNFNNAYMDRVTYTLPSAWEKTTIDSGTYGPYYFIRARVTTAGSQAVAEQIWLDGPGAGAALKWNSNININNCNFLANADDDNDPAAIEHPTAGTTFGYTDMGFSGNDYDIINTSDSTEEDSYSESNQDGGVPLDSDPTKVAQTFTTGVSTGQLTRASFYLIKNNSPTGNMTAELYATSGGAPTGSAVATSNTVAASSVGTAYELVSFEFEDEYTMSGSTTYAIAIDYTGDASNYIQAGIDTSAPGHGGTCYTYSGSWSSQSYDMCFYVYYGGYVEINLTDSPATTADDRGVPAGATKLVSSVTVTITVKDVAGDEIQNAQTGVFATDDGEQIINEDTNVSGVATENYGGSVPREVKVWVRKASSGATKYKNYSSVQNITSSGLALDVTLVEDPNNNATS